MKPKTRLGGRPEETKTPATMADEKKKTPAEISRQTELTLRTIYYFGIFVVGTILLCLILKKEGFKDAFESVIFTPQYGMVLAAAILFGIYGLLAKKNPLELANKVLTIIVVIMAIYLLVLWGGEKAYAMYKKHFGGGGEPQTISSYPSLGYSGHTSVDYEDSGEDFLGKGSHDFVLTDSSGRETGWMGVKKDVRKWDISRQYSSNDSLLIIFSDGDTIKSWVGGKKSIWRKKLKLVALVPMEMVVLTLD
jgi:hypothetical protein